MSGPPPRDIKDVIKLPVPDLSRSKRQDLPPPPALELVAHDATVSAGDIGGNPALIFDLMAPGFGSPMLIRITIPIHGVQALTDIGEGILRKASEMAREENDGPTNHQDA